MKTCFESTGLWMELLVLLTTAVAGPAPAQPSRCADCHIANPDAPEPSHVLAWSNSAHGRRNVGCESCHGGDASTFESLQAHMGILPSSIPESPVNRRNLPATCGRCHPGARSQFEKSRHYALLDAGKGEEGPTCSTCHSSVSADLLSPARLVQRCEHCHGEKRPHPRVAAIDQARDLLEAVAEVRETLRVSQRLLKRVADPARREQLEAAAQQAEVPLREAVEAGHSFRFEGMRDRLLLAQRRADDLLRDLGAAEP